ncbi:hypothetical protein [Winogradskyella sp. PE311]|uniref:hypothetical protein n=1 Tax=Winogradskyella sp. PE311 TaxID=3366943 RepID=UPI00398161E3
MKLKLHNILVFFSLLLICSCGSDYDKLVKRELATGKQYNDIFYDLKLGQPRSEFYETCWEYNKRKIFTHGPSNNSVQVVLYPTDTTRTTEKIRMLFYGKFSADKKIIGMDIEFSYVAWSPWNKNLTSEKLLPRVKDTLLKWYPGNDFIKVKGNLVKVDGNRQIRLSKGPGKDVNVVIEDLEHKFSNLNL